MAMAEKKIEDRKRKEKLEQLKAKELRQQKEKKIKVQNKVMAEEIKMYENRAKMRQEVDQATVTKNKKLEQAQSTIEKMTEDLNLVLDAVARRDPMANPRTFCTIKNL